MDARNAKRDGASQASRRYYYIEDVNGEDHPRQLTECLQSSSKIQIVTISINALTQTKDLREVLQGQSFLVTRQLNSSCRNDLRREKTTNLSNQTINAVHNGDLLTTSAQIP